jgi:glycine/D-amino acid oxidase-like deaminating enzyme
VTTPFWLDEPYEARAPLAGDVAVDIAVLGGGLTGVAAAYFLAARGCRVALMERDVLASGASGRNAGFLLCGVASTYSVAVKSHGRERSRILWSVSRDNHTLIRGLVESEGLDCLYARRGSYTLALSEQEAKALSRSAQLLAEDGFQAEYLDDTAVARLFPGGGLLAGLHHPGDGEIHPARFVRGLARAAERKGARIYERTPVTNIAFGADSAVLETPGGRLSTSMLLLASNAYTGLLHPYFDGAIVGMRGQMFATEPCAARVIPAPVYVDFGFEYYRQLPDGRILAGGGRRASPTVPPTRSRARSNPSSTPASPRPGAWRSPIAGPASWGSAATSFRTSAPCPAASTSTPPRATTAMGWAMRSSPRRPSAK